MTHKDINELINWLNFLPNEQLNGTYAIKLSEDPNHLKSIAKNALEFMGEID